MILSVSQYSYFRRWREGGFGIQAFLKEAAILGVAAEILMPWLGDGDERHLRNSPVPIAVVSVSNNFSGVDIDAQLAKITDGIKVAEEVGAQVVRVFAGDVPPDDRMLGVRSRIAKGLRRAAEIAEERDVTLALENHGRLAGRSMQVLGILDRINSPSLAANADTGNFLLVDEDPYAAVFNLQRHIEMLHLKDIRPTDENAQYISDSGRGFEGCAIGDGVVPFGHILTLRDWPLASIEYEGRGDPAEDVPRSVEFVRNLMSA